MTSHFVSIAHHIFTSERQGVRERACVRACRAFAQQTVTAGTPTTKHDRRVPCQPSGPDEASPPRFRRRGARSASSDASLIRHRPPRASTPGSRGLTACTGRAAVQDVGLSPPDRCHQGHRLIRHRVLQARVLG